MAAPVFISYARKSSLAEARALKAALGDLAFLDESEIETRAYFAQVIAEALMGARLAVVFADKTYFERPYCRWEWSLILWPKSRDHVWITIPAKGEFDLDALPPDLRSRNWNADDLPALLRKALEQNPPAIGPLIPEQDRDYLLASSHEQAQLPPVRTQALAKIPHRLTGAMGVSQQARFVGRAEKLYELHQKLSQGHMGESSSVSLVAEVQGGGGLGKSRLASEYVHRYAPEYFQGGVFWIQCETELETQFHEVARALDPATPPIDVLRRNQVDIGGLMRSSVQETVSQGGPALFVLDNVPEVTGKLVELDRYCPAQGLAAMLVTSRQSQAAGERIDLDVLSPESAWLLLTANLRNRGELSRAQWDQVSEWVGRLPLALEILNRALAHAAMPLRELHRRASGRETTVELDQLAAALPEIRRGVTETFEISYQVLSEEGQRAARLLAELGPEPAPEVLLEALGGFPSKVRMQLRSHSFVTGPMGDGVYGSMHRVLAGFLRAKSRLGAEEEEVEHFGRLPAEHARAVRAVEQVFEWKSDWQNPRDWGLLGLVRPHAEFLCGASEFGLATLGGWLGILSRAQGDLAGARELQEMALVGRRRVLGEEHPDTLTSMNNLANTLHAQGDLAGARELHEKALEVRRRVLGEEHPHTLGSMNNLALTLKDQGKLAAAQELQEHALEITRRTMGEEHPKTITSMNNLAQTLLEAGDLPGARKLQRQTLNLRQRVLGQDHIDTLQSMGNLASILYAEGNLAEALKLQREVLKVGRLVLGEKHPDTLTSMSNLAVTLKALGDVSGARLLYEQALRVREQALGEEHPDTLTLMNNLAELLRAQGDLLGARALHEKTLESRERVLGANHPETLRSMRNLAGILDEQGHLPGARKLYEQVLLISFAVLGEEHPDTLRTMNNLGVTLVAQADLAGARRLHERALEGRLRVLGEEHPDTIRSAWNLFRTLEPLGEKEAAGRVLREYLAPLVERDPGTLPANLREIQEQVKRMLD